MPSTLFTTPCYIETELYDLRIYTDDNSNEDSVSTIDDILLAIDTCESTSKAVNILNSTRLHFKSQNGEKNTTNPNNNDTIPEIINLNKLLSIKQAAKLSDESNSSSVSQRFEQFSSQETSKTRQVLLTESTQVDLSYVDISESFIWSVKRIELAMDSTSAQQLCSISSRYLSKLKHRPRHLLVFINPECGKGTGSSVYEEQVLPLFEEAKINVHTIYTERANHARDYINEQSLDDYDGLISVGGDGMFSELVHSLLLKTAQQTGLDINDPNTHLVPPKLRIGVIPAGSTDAVAFGTTGHNDPITNALQIILGESLLIDIATVNSEHGFVRFMATMFAYGFFGNIIQQSDQWRFFGPLRYTLAGVFQFIRNTSYHTELAITQASEKCNTKVPVENPNRYGSDNSIKQREIFGESSKADEQIDSEKSSLPLQIKRKGHYRTINCLNMPCRCDKSKFGMSPSVHLGDGSFDVVLVKHSWRLAFLQFLHHVANNGRAIEELSDVERYRATEVVIHPFVTRQEELGNWACDGELIKANEIRIRAHHQALNLFASGIRLDQIKKINEEESKIISTSVKEGFGSLTNILNAGPWRFVLLFLLLLVLFFLCYRFFIL